MSLPTTVPELLEAAAEKLATELEYHPNEYVCERGVCQVGAMSVALGCGGDWDRASGHAPLVEAACLALIDHHGERKDFERNGWPEALCPAEYYVMGPSVQRRWYDSRKDRIVQDMRALAAKLTEQASEAEQEAALTR